MKIMRPKGYQIFGFICVVIGVGTYLWLMAEEVVPTALELSGNLGMQVSLRDAWFGISAIAITVALYLDRWLSRKVRL